MTNANLLFQCNSLLASLSHASKKLKGINLNGCPVTDAFSRWLPPSPGCLKVNVDGAFSPHNGSGCGGILRDCAGSLQEAFMFKFLDGDSLGAELQALILGMELAWSKGLHNVTIEMDATEVFQLLKQRATDHHRHSHLIQQVRLYFERDWVPELIFIPRSSNAVADLLANKALGGELGYQLVTQITADLRGLL